MTRQPRRKHRIERDGRPLTIATGDPRSTGVRDLVVFCQDYRSNGSEKAIIPPKKDSAGDRTRLQAGSSSIG